MRNLVLYTGMVVMLLIMCYITLTIYAYLGLWYAIIFSLFEVAKTSFACIFYIKLISRD